MWLVLVLGVGDFVLVGIGVLECGIFGGGFVFLFGVFGVIYLFFGVDDKFKGYEGEDEGSE